MGRVCAQPAKQACFKKGGLQIKSDVSAAEAPEGFSPKRVVDFPSPYLHPEEILDHGGIKDFITDALGFRVGLCSLAEGVDDKQRFNYVRFYSEMTRHVPICQSSRRQASRRMSSWRSWMPGMRPWLLGMSGWRRWLWGNHDYHCHHHNSCRQLSTTFISCPCCF